MRIDNPYLVGKMLKNVSPDSVGPAGPFRQIWVSSPVRSGNSHAQSGWVLCTIITCSWFKNRSWILTIHKGKIFYFLKKKFPENKEMVFKIGIKNMQTKGYNGTYTRFILEKSCNLKIIFQSTVALLEGGWGTLAPVEFGYTYTRSFARAFFYVW